MKRRRFNQRARHYKKRSKAELKPSTLQPVQSRPMRSQLIREALNHEDFLTHTFNNIGDIYHDQDPVL